MLTAKHHATLWCFNCPVPEDDDGGDAVLQLLTDFLKEKYPSIVNGTEVGDILENVAASGYILGLRECTWSMSTPTVDFR